MAPLSRAGGAWPNNGSTRYPRGRSNSVAPGVGPIPSLPEIPPLIPTLTARTYRPTAARTRVAFDADSQLCKCESEESSRVLGNFKLRVLVAWICRGPSALQLLERVGENVIVTQTRVRIPREGGWNDQIRVTRRRQSGR